MPPGSPTEPTGPHLWLHYCHPACFGCVRFCLIFTLQERSRRPSGLLRVNSTLFLSLLCLPYSGDELTVLPHCMLNALSFPSHCVCSPKPVVWDSPPLSPKPFNLLTNICSWPSWSLRQSVSQASVFLCLLSPLPTRPNLLRPLPAVLSSGDAPWRAVLESPYLGQWVTFTPALLWPLAPDP